MHGDAAESEFALWKEEAIIIITYLEFITQWCCSAQQRDEK